MAYSVTTNDGITISIADENKDSSSLSLTLIGRNATNYGQSIATNTLKHLENFASTTAPSPSTTPTGQIWYNKTDATLRVYDGTRWKRATSIPVSSAAITGDLTGGTAYFNTTTDQLNVYDGSRFRTAVLPGGTVTSQYAGNVTASGNASNYGAKVETLFIEEQTTSEIIPVLAIKYVSDATSGYAGLTADPVHDSAEATIMALFSERQFDVANTDPYYTELSNVNGIGATIQRGLNQRVDYTSSAIALATSATWAAKANAVYDGSIIPAQNLIHVGTQNWTPSGTVSSNYELGNATNRFGQLHVDTIHLGEALQTNRIGIKGTVDIGNASSTVNHIYTRDLTVTGNLDFSGINDLTNLENATITNVTITSGTISTYPTANSDIAHKQYVDDAAVAATATKLTLVATNNTNATHYPVFVDTATGNEQPRTDTGFTYNPNSGTLTASVFAGAATSARYADLAEKYSSDDDYIAGTVVKIGGSAEITQTTSHADTEVFGVISTDPAYLMNSEADGLPVALQGRVPVRVVGKLTKGERLVSSDIPGVAWGVADEDVSVQAIIGRSLEDKDDSGLGIVEAVIGVK